MKWYDVRIWKWACIGLVIGIILLAFAGCKTKEYIKVPSVRTEYIVKTDTFAKLDSIYMKDSVYVFQKGDTVFHNKVVYRDRYRNIYKVKTDTIIKTDSVAVPYPVERQLTNDVAGQCYIAFLFILAVCAIGFTLWYRNKKC